MDERPEGDDVAADQRGMQWLAAVLILVVLALATWWLVAGLGLP